MSNAVLYILDLLLYYFTAMDSPIQLDVLSAGCQPWNFQVVAASGRRFAYCATLSVYIYEVFTTRFTDLQHKLLTSL